MAKKLRDMKVEKMEVKFGDNSNSELLIQRLSKLKDQPCFSGLEYFTYELSQDGNN